MADASDPAASPPATDAKDKVERREIKGGLPYTTAPGVLKTTLDLIIPAERPDKFTGNYMSTVLKLSGGSARAVPPLLKKMNFIGTDGTPTNIYSKFKTDGGRSQAAYEGLRASFGELFRRNEYIHKADEATVKDMLVEITGLKKSDPIIRAIYGTFDAIKGFITNEVSAQDAQPTEGDDAGGAGSEHNQANPSKFQLRTNSPQLGLQYNINIVLPETENVAVLNAIFRSLRDNLLRQ